MNQKILFITVFLFSILKINAQTEPIKISGYAQGTTYSITYYDKEKRDFKPEIDKLLKEFDHSVSLWDSTSVICRVNRNVPEVKLDKYFIDCFNKSQETSIGSNGAGKVVKDCVYQVMADSCAYSTLEWVRVDAVVAKGSDLNPVWPDVASNATQRPGSKVETYTVTFLSNDKTYTYSPSTQQEFSRFTNGSKWKLTINGLNVVTKVESAP